jgi:hypothetical protein
MDINNLTTPALVASAFTFLVNRILQYWDKNTQEFKDTNAYIIMFSKEIEMDFWILKRLEVTLNNETIKELTKLLSVNPSFDQRLSLAKMDPMLSKVIDSYYIAQQQITLSIICLDQYSEILHNINELMLLNREVSSKL